jgi:HEAT repeat protein
MRLRALLVLAFAAASCDGQAAPPPPPPPPPPPAPPPPAQVAPAPAPAPAPPGVPKPGLPPRPKDEAERLRGLVRLLERGDAPLVEFAQEALAEFPDPDAAAAALREAGEGAMGRNLSFVQNILGAVRNEALGSRLEPFLLRCFEAPDPQVKRLALVQYAQSASKPDPAAIAKCATDGWAPVAMAAFRALEILKSPAASEALRAAFPRVGPFARAAACNALGRLGDREAIPILRAVLAEARAAGDRETSLRLGAAQGLARLGDEEGIRELRAWVTALPLERPAVPLDYGADEWEGPEAILAAARDPVLRARLVLQARQGSPDSAASAIRALAVHYPPDTEIAGALSAANDRADADFTLVAECLDALRRRNAADGKGRALAALESPLEERRYGAALALGRWGDPETVPALLARLKKDPAMAVRRKSCDALGRIGDPAAAPALVAFLAAEPEADPAAALQAMTAAGNLRGPLADAGAEALAALTAPGGKEAVRAYAARALGRARKSPAARPALVALLRDPSPAIRAAAADALGSLGDAAARNDLAGAYAREGDEGAWSAEMDAILRVDLRNP